MIWLLVACAAEGPDDTAERPEARCEPRVWHADADGDGYGNAVVTVESCGMPAGFVANGVDCADANPAIHPGAAEACNTMDDDCDGAADPGASTWADTDGDGFGDPATAACLGGADRVADATDCDDADAATHPGAEEVCDGDDDDCDGVADVGAVGVWYTDADGDRYGDDTSASETCLPSEGAATVGGDCDPADPTVFPGAPEACDEEDDSCDGVVDEGCALTGDIPLSDADALVFGDVGDELGKQLKVGDVTGDGVDDLVMGTLARGSFGGAAILAGGPRVSGDIDGVGHRIEVGSGSSGASRSVGVGDVDGDGVADIGIGVPYATDDGVRIVLGPVTGDRMLESAIWIAAAPGVFAGHGGDLGDVDGDGLEDAVIGAHADSEGGSWAGAVWVVYGPLDADVDLESEGDVKIVSEEDSSGTGRWVRADGDYNGDGVSDILAGSPLSSIAAPQGGGAYVVYGPPPDDLFFSDADCIFLGTSPNDYVGTGLGYGDVDGDGVDDVLLGGVGSGTAGSAYVFLAPGGTLTTADAELSFAGDAVAESLGTDLRGGDLDGDGLGEVLLGAYGAERFGGAVYVYRGPAPGTYGPSDADVRLLGTGGENAGVSVQIGDLDADGAPEVFVGASAYAGKGGVYTFTGW